MGINRSDFTLATKRLLAARVAYKCCFLNCNRITIGPNSIHDDKTLILGEAAHIYAAAPGGPRYRPDMTDEERKSINNGIWMCRGHAKFIDADYEQYAATTLLQWKEIAEAKSYQYLKELKPDEVSVPTTMVNLDLNLMFDGVWKAAEKNVWTFVVKKFIWGGEEILKKYGASQDNMLNYIIVESQGDGRLIKEFSWQLNSKGEFEIKVEVTPPALRRNPNNIGGDISLDWQGDLNIEEGDFKKVSGKEFAKQLIQRNLSLPLGGWQPNLLLGSLFSHYYHQYHKDTSFLNRLIKIELTRLITIPTYQMEVDEPELNFINRIIEVKILSKQNNTVPVFISLEWADGTNWADTIYISLYDAEDNHSDGLPEFMKTLFQQQPLDKLKQLTSQLNKEELKDSVNDKVIISLFCETLPALMENTKSMLEEEIYPLFTSYELYRTIDENHFPFLTSVDLELALMKRTVREIGIVIKLNGFKKAGVNAFDIYHPLIFYLNDYSCDVGISKEQIWKKKLYDQHWLKEDFDAISNFWINSFVKEINKKIAKLLE